MSTRTRRQYTKAERHAVIRDAAEMGVCAAAREHGIAASCVSRWASEARLRKRSRGAVAKTPPRKSRGAEAKASAGAKAELTPSTKPPRSSSSSKGRVVKRYTPSQKAAVLEYASEHGVTAAAAKFEVSRFSIYAWQKKLEKAARGQGPSPTSGPAPSEVEATRDREILDEWQRHPGLGPSQIRNQLRRKSIKVSVHTVRRVMEDAGYRPPKVERKSHDKSYEAVRPNHLWHLDFVHRHINRSSTFTLILIDDCSRYVVGHGVDDAERADMVIETFERAVERHGGPENVMNDKGSAF